jgi:TatA/E family protein of Tat protein translocase
MNIGLPEVLIVLLILLLLFGGRRIPELGRALGSGFRNLREHVGRGPPGGGEIDEGEEASRPSSTERVEDEETARRP